LRNKNKNLPRNRFVELIDKRLLMNEKKMQYHKENVQNNSLNIAKEEYMNIIDST